MDALLNDISGLIITMCDCSGQCMYGTYNIIVAQVVSVIEKLNPGKKDGTTQVVSHRIINANVGM